MSINSNNKSNVKNNLNLSKGSFSETTTASFSTDNFINDGIDDDDIAEGGELAAGYSFNIGLGTSFTGEDSLDISIDAGSTGGVDSVGEFSTDGAGDELVVDGVTYTFPVGDATVVVGDDTDSSPQFT